jgi:ABC-2 type transport system permease protein
MSTPNSALAPCRAQRASGWRLFLKTVLARAYPRIVGQQREKSWIFFDIFLPMLAVSSYVFVYRAIQAPEAFVGFVVIGGAMTAFWMNIMWSMSSQLYWEKEQGNLALYIMAPNSMMAMLLGMALGGMLATFLRAIVIVLGARLSRELRPGEPRAAHRGVLRHHGRTLWHGDDERLPVSAAEP